MPRNPYARATTVNPENFPSFQRSDEEAYLQVLLTNTVGGTFYATSQELLAESLALHAKLAASDPDFMARALVYARNEGLMRLQPIAGLAYLAKADRDLFRRVFSQVIRTPGDLTDFVEIVRGDVVPGGMGRSIKSVVNGWLNGLSEYHAIKYARGGQGYSLRDVLRVSHPMPVNPLQDAIFMWLAEPERWRHTARREFTPQIDAFEQLKALNLPEGSDQAPARALIEAGRLPYEVVTGVFKPDVATWVALMEQMPYMALLRHLNTLQRAGVLSIVDHARYVAGRLGNIEALRKAKVLPFRLFTAYQMFEPQENAEILVQEALAQALEHAFVNLPDLAGRVCIAPDVSGSMNAPLSHGTVVRYIDVAGIFAGALLKLSANAVVLPFENKVVNVNLDPHDSLITTADKLARIGGGGTAVSAPISLLLERRIPIDTFIGITDNVEWAVDQFGREGFLPTWLEYKQTVAPRAQAFLLTIAPYRTAVAPQDTPDVHYIYGWSDAVLAYIAMAQRGLAGQVETVRALPLD